MMTLTDATLLERFKQALELTPQKSTLAVIGLGITGLSVIRFLNRYSFQPIVLDTRSQPPLITQLRKEFPYTTLITGDLSATALMQYSHLIVSPGLSLKHPAIKKAIIHGVKIISDIDLFALATDQPIVAITGSNGKSTVTTMLGDMALASGVNTAIGGNLGIPALDLWDQKVQLYVLELSSFQLERCSQLHATIATVLNISEDHLDRHKTLENYITEKTKIFQGCDTMVLNADDKTVAQMHIQGHKTVWFSLNQSIGFHITSTENGDYFAYGDCNLMPCVDLPLEGQHNKANALTAFAIGWSLGLNVTSMCQALTSFTGLAHRMQFVAHIDGIDWINDSKATNTGACIAALKGYQKKVILLAGGDTKEADMTELKISVEKQVKNIILMGQDALLIDTALNYCVPVSHVDSMQEAVRVARKIAKKGDTVLLSPACASFDQYKNYQHRGEIFIASVMALETIDG